MKFTEYDINLVEAKAYRRPTNVRFLNEFVNSGLPCAKVEEFTQRNAYGCANSLRKTAMRERLYHVKVSVRGNEVYLINQMLVHKKKIV